MASASTTFEDWVVVFSCGTDYEADLVRDRLDDAGFRAVVLTQRDHAFNLTVGDLASVHVMTPPSEAEEARALIEERVSDEDLERAAAEAGGETEDPAHDGRREAMLDSGNESVKLGDPGGTREADERPNS